MTYETPEALRIALEQRLLTRSKATGVALDRLRRRVMFERIVSRLHTAEPGRWVLKGGMALEVRLRDNARLTKDVDVGLRDEVSDGEELRERLIEALQADPDGDRFVLIPGRAQRLAQDHGGDPTWRVQVAAQLAGRQFGGIRLDVSPRNHELQATDFVQLPNSLDFAGVATPVIEIIDVNRHAAEKLHGMLMDFGERENTRVRDLVDLVILCEHELLAPSTVAAAAVSVWAERDGAAPPAVLAPVPAGWAGRYELLADEHGLDAATFRAAVGRVGALWTEMFPIETT